MGTRGRVPISVATGCHAVDEIAGQIACGTYNDSPDVTWTKDADLLLADAQGPNLEDLHKWWNDFG